MQFVIDQTTKKLKRYGACDFANDGSFDTATEQIIESDVVLTAPLEDQAWFWNAATGEFQTMPV